MTYDDWQITLVFRTSKRSGGTQRLLRWAPFFVIKRTTSSGKFVSFSTRRNASAQSMTRVRESAEAIPTAHAAGTTTFSHPSDDDRAIPSSCHLPETTVTIPVSLQPVEFGHER